MWWLNRSLVILKLLLKLDNRYTTFRTQVILHSRKTNDDKFYVYFDSPNELTKSWNLTMHSFSWNTRISCSIIDNMITFHKTSAFVVQQKCCQIVHMGQVTKLRLSCYLVLLSIDSKPGNKTATVLWPDPYDVLTIHTCAFHRQYSLQDHLANVLRFWLTAVTLCHVHMYMLMEATFIVVKCVCLNNGLSA